MKKYYLYIVLFLLTILSSCKKNFLDKKPNSSIIVPKSLNELQLLLENSSVMNVTGGLAQISADEFIIPDHLNYLSLRRETWKNAYVWNAELYDGETGILDWNDLYKTVFYANNVLHELQINSYKDTKTRDNIEGWALFCRSYAFYDLVSNFSAVYNPKTADKDLGIPIRIAAGIDELKQRATVKESYDQIILDLKRSIPLLYTNVDAAHPNRPSKPAAYAMLSRIYLYMGEYDFAERYADSCLYLFSKLEDYNNVSKTEQYPFAYVSQETIYYSAQVNDYADLTFSAFTPWPYSIKPELLSSYHTDDLRPDVFFIKHANGIVNSKARYTLDIKPFTGLATDEIILIKTECLARRNKLVEATTLLNVLLSKRFANYVNAVPGSKDDVMEMVLLERQKELVWRGLRWTDIKRLNRESHNIVLKRVLNGVTYTLPPNDPRYIFQIPPDEISKSGIRQNDRGL